MNISADNLKNKNMSKRKFFAPLMGAVVLGLSAYAGYRTYDAYHGVSESDLLLENAEALANGGEDSPYEFPTGYERTSTCNVKIGDKPWDRCKVELVSCPGGGSGCNTKKCPVHKA